MPNFYVVDVAHGNSAVLVDTQGVVVVDAGKGSKLLEFLSLKEINQIDVLLLSHADSDHIGGVIALLASEIVEIKAIYVNPDAMKNSQIWDDLLYSLYSKDKQHKLTFEPNITPALTGKINQGMVHIEVLAPNKYIVAKGSGSRDRHKNKLTTNSISAVVRFIYKDNPIVLLPADIDQTGLNNLCQDTRDIKAQVLVFPHHGGHSGGDLKKFTEQICHIVQPEHIIFSIGKNKDKFPRQEVLETISRMLPDTAMYTTNNSDLFQTHITSLPTSLHKNNVGHILIDFKQSPLQLKVI